MRVTASSQATGGAWYDVHRSLFPFGLREFLGRFQAPTRVEADRIAAEKYGFDIMVTLSTKAKPRRRRALAKDLGDTNRRKP